MAEKKSQTFANHTRLDPPFHFFVLPVFVLGLVLTLIHFFYHLRESGFHENFHAFLLILLALALLTLLLKVRVYSLKVQDRVIRLEERLRMQSLLQPALLPRIGELNEAQIVALRFASDGELPGLVEKALASKMKPADIKKSIQNWRADTFRV